MNRTLKKPLWPIILITILGAGLRVINITGYNIYSDSYDFMLAAKNLVEKGTLDGPLGNGGMHWSPLLYNRIGFSYLIAPFYALTDKLELSAHILPLILSVASIPMIYFLAVKIFKRREIGIIASLLLTISFSNIMLSGMIMANSVVVFFIILSLLVFLRALDHTPLKSIKKNIASRANLKAVKLYVLSGFLMAITCFLRIELLALLPAFIFLIIIQNNGKNVMASTIYFLVSFMAFASIFFYSIRLFLSDIALWAENQIYFLAEPLSKAWIGIPIIIIVFALVFYRLRRKGDILIEKSSLFYGLLIIIPLLVAIVLSFIFRGSYNWQAIRFTFRTEWLIIILGFLGMIPLFKKNSKIALFFYLSMLPLASLYFVMSRGWDFRHINILSVFLIIIASFFIYQIFLFLNGKINSRRYSKYRTIILLLILIIIGTIGFYQTGIALTAWHSSVSYEKELGMTINKVIEKNSIPKDTVLFSFFPDSSYFYTGMPCYEENKDIPVLTPNIKRDQKVILVIDEGTRDNYPELANKADKEFDEYLLESSMISVPYQYKEKSYWSRGLTNIYLIDAGIIDDALSN